MEVAACAPAHLNQGPGAVPGMGKRKQARYPRSRPGRCIDACAPALLDALERLAVLRARVGDRRRFVTTRRQQ